MTSAVLQMLDSAIQGPFQLGALLSALAMLTLMAVHTVSDYWRNPSRLPFPPGPKGYPLIGNIFDMPTSKQWLQYDEWAKIYGQQQYFGRRQIHLADIEITGDVFSYEVLGQRIIVLNSLEATQELFEKRSANYSDRPRMPMICELYVESSCMLQ